jgi:hypothetical protein
MLDVPHVPQVCLLNGVEAQYSEFLHQSCIYLFVSQDVSTGATWQIPG